MWGTMSLFNHNENATGRFTVLNNELDDMESGFKLSYNYAELTIRDHDQTMPMLTLYNSCELLKKSLRYCSLESMPPKDT